MILKLEVAELSSSELHLTFTTVWKKWRKKTEGNRLSQITWNTEVVLSIACHHGAVLMEQLRQLSDECRRCVVCPQSQTVSSTPVTANALRSCLIRR